VQRAARITALAVLVLAALGAVVARTPLHAPLFVAFWNPWAEHVPAMLDASARNWLVAAGHAAIVFLLVRNAARTKAWLAVAGAFMLVDLGTTAFDAVPRMPARFYDEPPALARQLPPDREQWRLFQHAEWHRKREAVRPYFERHPDLYWVMRNALAPMTPPQYGVRMVLDSDYDMTALQPTADFVKSIIELTDLRPDWLDVAASMSNVWYRAVFRDPREAFAEARGDRRVLQPVGILDVGRYPRYYLAARVETIADREDFVRKLASPTYRKGTAFVQGMSFAPAAGRVTRVRETANTARIELETAGRAFLVMSVTPHKYWRVTVNGAEAQAVVANVGYQGLVIPGPGRHVVEMRYRNPLIAVGAIISAVSLLVLAFITMRRL
jgi:hypothetical protein